MTVDQFEAFVQAQQPARTPWAPVTDYSLEARTAIEGEHPQRIKDVFEPSMVIDAGCGPDGILVRLLTAINVEALGFDQQIPTRAVNPRLMRGSLIDANLMTDQERPFADLVICREVLEHLTVLQVRQAVRNLVRMTTRYVYVTTRFHPDPMSLLDVQDHDDLDPTHITLLHQDFLRLLFVLEGCRRRADLETAMDWQHKGRVLVYERA